MRQDGLSIPIFHESICRRTSGHFVQKPGLGSAWPGLLRTSGHFVQKPGLGSARPRSPTCAPPHFWTFCPEARVGPRAGTQDERSNNLHRVRNRLVELAPALIDPNYPSFGLLHARKPYSPLLPTSAILPAGKLTPGVRIRHWGLAPDLVLFRESRSIPTPGQGSGTKDSPGTPQGRTFCRPTRSSGHFARSRCHFRAST